jgi:hypothetical protein
MISIQDRLKCLILTIMEYWSDGVLECCKMIFSFSPLLQYSKVDSTLRIHLFFAIYLKSFILFLYLNFMETFFPRPQDHRFLRV